MPARHPMWAAGSRVMQKNGWKFKGFLARSHPVGHHRVWIETARDLRNSSQFERHPVCHHRVWIETTVWWRVGWSTAVTRWVTTGYSLKPHAGSP